MELSVTEGDSCVLDETEIAINMSLEFEEEEEIHHPTPQKPPIMNYNNWKKTYISIKVLNLKISCPYSPPLPRKLLKKYSDDPELKNKFACKRTEQKKKTW